MHLQSFTFSIHSETFWHIKNTTILLLHACSEKEESICARQCSGEFHISEEIRVRDKTAYICKGYIAQIQSSFIHTSGQELWSITFHPVPHTISVQLPSVEQVLYWSFQSAWFQWIDSLLFFGSPQNNACRICQTNAGEVKGQWQQESWFSRLYPQDGVDAFPSVSHSPGLLVYIWLHSHYMSG